MSLCVAEPVSTSLQGARGECNVKFKSWSKNRRQQAAGPEPDDDIDTPLAWELDDPANWRVLRESRCDS